ncbi:hypothetical protein B484DRAFT_436946, partial [Ochromonadaceae sp. CCMP2298]
EPPNGMAIVPVLGQLTQQHDGIIQYNPGRYSDLRRALINHHTAYYLSARPAASDKGTRGVKENGGAGNHVFVQQTERSKTERCHEQCMASYANSPKGCYDTATKRAAKKNCKLRVGLMGNGTWRAQLVATSTIEADKEHLYDYADEYVFNV